MNKKAVIQQLRTLRPEVPKLMACLGCEYRDLCSVHGCKVITEAIAYLAERERKDEA